MSGPGGRPEDERLLAVKDCLHMRVYTFKVYPRGVPKKRPDAPWRKIEIAGTRTLDDLHEAIFDAFDRDDEGHLYAFFLGGGKSKTGRDRFEGIKYTSPEGMTSGRERNSMDTPIESLGLHVGDYLRYLFDFGSERWHVVELTDIEERAEGALKYPRVVAKNGEPADNSGNGQTSCQSWVEYLESALVFPFEAEVSEYQFGGQLQMGDRFVAKKIVNDDAKYGVLVEGRVGRRKIHFALVDLEPVDDNSPNQGPIDKYKEWFSARQPGYYCAVPWHPAAKP